jgi:hypothetical protein
LRQEQVKDAFCCPYLAWTARQIHVEISRPH